MDRKNKQFYYVFLALVITTVLSQNIDLSSRIRPFMYAMWMVNIVLGFVLLGIHRLFNFFVILYLAAIFIVSIECTLFLESDISQQRSYMQYVFPLPLICYLSGLIFIQTTTVTERKVALGVYIVLSTLLSFIIYKKYYGSFYTWYDANTYIYEQKNSIAQILSSCIIILSVYYHKKIYKPFTILLSIVLFVFIVLFQCRSAIVSLFIVLVYTQLFSKHKLSYYALIIVVGLLVCQIAIDNDQVRYIIEKAIIFNERQKDGIDNLTSGRTIYYKEAFNVFLDNPILGVGHYRVDNLYLTVLAELGIVGFIPIMSVLFYRFYKNFSGEQQSDTLLTKCLKRLSLMYLVESILEAYPPFGPGVCSYMFWILCSFLDYERENKIKSSI